MITTYYLTLLGQASGHPTDLKKIAFRAEGLGSTRKRTQETPTVRKSLQAKDYAAHSAFRHAIRKLLRFSKELVATRAELTTEQYDVPLAIKGSSGANGVTVGEISEQLQVKHHTAVSLLDRLEARKLATRKRATADKRNVNVQLTKADASLLARLAAIHHRELQQRTPEIIDALQPLRE